MKFLLDLACATPVGLFSESLEHKQAHTHKTRLGLLPAAAKEQNQGWASQPIINGDLPSNLIIRIFSV
jgi:hypothetical protein